MFTSITRKLITTITVVAALLSWFYVGNLVTMTTPMLWRIVAFFFVIFSTVAAIGISYLSVTKQESNEGDALKNYMLALLVIVLFFLYVPSVALDVFTGKTETYIGKITLSRPRKSLTQHAKFYDGSAYQDVDLSWPQEKYYHEHCFSNYDCGMKFVIEYMPHSDRAVSIRTINDR